MLGVQLLVWVFLIYLVIGLLFGSWFVFKGVQKIDEGMDGAKWYMRLLLLPGTLGFWPILLSKYLQRKIRK